MGFHHLNGFLHAPRGDCLPLEDERDTLVRRVEALGFSPSDVGAIVLTHADPDHTGGLAELPAALPR
jgi:glyoxylase-like metal-dependent hydrolase (beta-lactamase superfamily II)